MNAQQELAICKAKIAALELYGDHFEKSLHVLAQGLARDGYSSEEISEALLFTMPTMKAGCAQIQTAIDKQAAKVFANG